MKNALFVIAASLLAPVHAEPSVLVASARMGASPMPLIQRPPPADTVESPAFPSSSSIPVPAADSARPIGGVVLRALSAICLVILAQTIGDHAALPEVLRALVRGWQETRAAWPLAVATACASFLYGASDALSQCFLSTSRRGTVDLDVRRMLRTSLTASFLSGYLAVFYFGWLEHATSPHAWSWAQLAGTGGVSSLAQWVSVACKIAVDIGLYEPIYDVLYITLQTLLRGEGLDVAAHQVRHKVIKVWRMAPTYWTFADAINFGVVPLRLRPMANALFSLPWGMYISSVANA